MGRYDSWVRQPFPFPWSVGRTSVLVALVGLTGLLLGVLTAFGQKWLPVRVGSLANSTGSWCLVAFLLALLATSRRVAVVCGALALASLLAGYVLGASVRGYPSSRSLLVFWGLAAVLVGPILGLGADWVKSGRPALAALGTGAISGLLVGEGVYGLAFIADTTYPPYWWGEMIVGIALLCWVSMRRFRRLYLAALAVVFTLVVAVAFVQVYSQDLISMIL